MLTLYICDWDISITTADGIEMTVKDVAVEGIDELICLRDYEPSTPIEDVQVYLIGDDDDTLLPLPDAMRIAIASYLSHQHGKVDLTYMCFDFAHQCVFGLSRPERPSGDRYWTYAPLPKGALAPGSVVKLFRETEGRHTPFAHAAVYLGHDLFLSVYGAGGDLEVSTLDAMMKDYAAPFATLAIPKL